jgi:hypothetical protein
MRLLGDRRVHLRFDIVGRLWTTLDDAQLRVVNISRTGALLASLAPLLVDSQANLRLAFANQDLQIRARVRHVTQVVDDRYPYRLGVEFLEQPAPLLEALGM